jgi:TPR repeat protein
MSFLENKGISREEYQKIRLNAHKKRAEKGEVLSQFYYANLIRSDDLVEAEKYYNLAAEQNYIPAITMLMYEYSDIGEFETDQNKELYWTRKGIELGDVSSMLKMARDYSIGEIIEKNEAEQEQLLVRAAKLESAEAYVALSQMLKFNKNQQMQFLRNAISLAGMKNDRDAFESACFGLGWNYKPIENNPDADAKKSCYFFFLAYALGNEHALHNGQESGYTPQHEELEAWGEDARNLKVRM